MYAGSFQIGFRSSEDPNMLSDVTDGLIYKKLSQKGLISSDDLTMTFNTDGSPVFKAAKNSLWPIQFRLNNLPLDERFDSHRTLLGGLWFGSKEPTMSTYLLPFINECDKLANTGLQWTDIKGKNRLSKVFLISCVLDSIAKPALQNTKQFNGKFGCPYCYHPGDIIDGNQVRYKINMYPGRTDKSMRKDMKEAERTVDVVKGIKGLSPLHVLPYFNLVYGFVIDYMHCCLLGATKLLATLWTDSKYHLEDFHLVKGQVQKIDAKLVQITPPTSISRRPRPLSDMVHWKANEWRSWLLFYSVPCLKGILPAKYLKNYGKFVTAIYILLQSSIKKNEIDVANGYLYDFVSEFEQLYGPIHMNFNIHLLLHLSECVKYWGPLWLYSAFPFETGNGYLVKLTKGTKGVVKQISKKYCIFSSIPSVIKNRKQLPDKVLQYCDEIMSYKRLKKAKCNNGVVICGRAKEFHPNSDELDAIIQAGIQDYAEYLCTDKIIHKAKALNCKGKTHKRYDDSIVRLHDETYYEINRFIYTHTNEFVVYAPSTEIEIDLQNVITDSKGNILSPHIKACKPYFYGKVKLLSLDDIICKSIIMNIYTDTYIADFPNNYEKD